jgi:hypothetical protein
LIKIELLIDCSFNILIVSITIIKMRTLLLLCILFAGLQFATAQNAVNLRDVSTLTFNRGQYTTFRRTNALPQLNCVGGSARRENYQVSTVQCRNVGFDGVDYNWRCESNLNNKLKLGRVVVSCEGYNRPGDKYVLGGSCALKYELEYSDPVYETENMVALVCGMIFIFIIVLWVVIGCYSAFQPSYYDPYRPRYSSGFFEGYWLSSLFSGRNNGGNNYGSGSSTSSSFGTTERR